jgi:hypothetical protein
MPCSSNARAGETILPLVSFWLKLHGAPLPMFPLFLESKPQQTGTRLLPGHGEVATTSGSTSAFGAIADSR